MNRQKPTVILGDMIGSRHLPDRRRMVSRIRKVLAKVTDELEAGTEGELFAARPRLVKGIDEMSAVMWEPSRAYRLCRLINYRIAPNRIRFAIVSGNVDIGLDTGDASQMDGPAFHIAAEGIERARKRSDVYYIRCAEDQAADRLLTVLANMVHAAFERLSEHQRRATILYDELKDQRKVARKMGITQQAVSDALRSAQYRLLASANEELDNYLSGLQTEA